MTCWLGSNFSQIWMINTHSFYRYSKHQVPHRKPIPAIIVSAMEGFTCHACSVRLFCYYPFQLSFMSHASDFERHTRTVHWYNKTLRSCRVITVGWADVIVSIFGCLHATWVTEQIKHMLAIIHAVVWDSDTPVVQPISLMGWLNMCQGGGLHEFSLQNGCIVCCSQFNLMIHKSY